MFTMLPLPAGMCGSARRERRSTGHALIATVCSQASRSPSRMVSPDFTPALLTSTSRRPCSPMTSSTSAANASVSVTSSVAGVTGRPARPSRSAVSSIDAAVRPVASTVAPAAAKPPASADPIPPAAPVTITTLSRTVKRSSSVSLVTRGTLAGAAPTRRPPEATIRSDPGGNLKEPTQRFRRPAPARPGGPRPRRAATATVRPGRARRAGPWQLRPPAPPSRRRGVLPPSQPRQSGPLYPGGPRKPACRDVPELHGCERPRSAARSRPPGQRRRHPAPRQPTPEAAEGWARASPRWPRPRSSARARRPAQCPPWSSSASPTRSPAVPATRPRVGGTPPLRWPAARRPDLYARQTLRPSRTSPPSRRRLAARRRPTSRWRPPGRRDRPPMRRRCRRRRRPSPYLPGGSRRSRR